MKCLFGQLLRMPLGLSALLALGQISGCGQVLTPSSSIQAANQGIEEPEDTKPDSPTKLGPGIHPEDDLVTDDLETVAEKIVPLCLESYQEHLEASLLGTAFQSSPTFYSERLSDFFSDPEIINKEKVSAARVRELWPEFRLDSGLSFHLSHSSLLLSFARNRIQQIEAKTKNEPFRLALIQGLKEAAAKRHLQLFADGISENDEISNPEEFVFYCATSLESAVAFGTLLQERPDFLLQLTPTQVDGYFEYLASKNIDFIVQSLRDAGLKPSRDVLNRAITHDRFELFEKLVDWGAAHAESNFGDYSPLSVAASFERLEMLKRLLELEPPLDINLQDYNGWTPLVHAAYRGNLEAVDLLIKHGARYDFLPSASGRLDRHTLKLEVREYFRSKGIEEVFGVSTLTDAELEVRRNPIAYTESEVAAILDGKTDLLSAHRASLLVSLGEECQQCSLLALFVSKGRLDLSRKLLNLDVDPNTLSSILSVDGEAKSHLSPLAVAVWRGDLEHVRLLLQAGADPNTGSYQRPLTLAIAQRQHEIAAHLLKTSQIDFQKVDGYYGKTPFLLALETGDTRFIKMIWQLNRGLHNFRPDFVAQNYESLLLYLVHKGYPYTSLEFLLKHQHTIGDGPLAMKAHFQVTVEYFGGWTWWTYEYSASELAEKMDRPLLARLLRRYE